MNKVYLVCSGERSEFEIEGSGWTDCLVEGVFDADHKAEAFAKHCQEHDNEKSEKLGKPNTTVYWVEEHQVQR